ncbi:hypothetical protein [Actinoplanes friuliensis]|uniref:Uncharacterized protein n=1 Tax=Actinoplanes friuliensis DSM 7358 TaxID=1246995 RepID=U5VV80_9ACTN|nr:hypothetical protein [Actinoplanes friuliensis]AGZ39605.1 hypothetical protein AFR_06580 [Actinoplanes friuliensis DSM 7358]
MAISRRDKGGEDVSNPAYMKTVSMGQGLAAVDRTAKPLTDRAGRKVKPVGKQVKGKWYDADLN